MILTDELKQKYLSMVGISGFRGVVACKQDNFNGFSVNVCCNGMRFAGFYTDKIEAAIAYDRLANLLLGSMAITNKDLGLLTDEMMKNKEPYKIHDSLLHWRDRFLKFIQNAGENGTTLRKFLEINEKLSRYDHRELYKFVFYLEHKGLIRVERIGSQVAYFKVYPINPNPLENKEPPMKDNNDLMNKTPEELEALAKQITALSEAKKEEIRNGDQIRKTLNPLVLAVCQAKGKYDRLLEQQLDAMTELDNAVKALKEALKLSK